MKHLNRAGIAGVCLVLVGLMMGVAAGTRVVYGQPRPADGQKKMAMSGMSMSNKDSAGTVFCPGMSTGQLCPMGTVATLKLTERQKQRWSAAVSQYNKAVGEATRQLLASAKQTLSPAQYAQVKSWFAVGLNPEINRLLSSRQVSSTR